MNGKGREEGKASLILTNVAAWRGGRLLFEGVDLDLGPGDAAAITGRNGIGKSTLLRIAAGLLAPLSGTVAASSPLAYLPADGDALDPRLPLRRALGFWAGLDGTGGTVVDALDAMGIAALADVPVRLFSTGQRRRAALARTIASGARLWLLDEPGNGLDGDGVARLAAAMAAQRAGGGIVLVATHQPLDLPGAHAISLE
jgi:heme exporter protein A